MTSLTSLGWQIHDHLKEFRPKMLQVLKAERRLNDSILHMQNQASQRMQALENAGLYHHEAWEIVKDDVLLPSEEDLPNLRERDGLRRLGVSFLHFTKWSTSKL